MYMTGKVLEVQEENSCKEVPDIQYLSYKHSIPAKELESYMETSPLIKDLCFLSWEGAPFDITIVTEGNHGQIVGVAESVD
jgi:hypothetical protein